MSKYKAGDKVVLEVLSIDGDGYYTVGSEHYSWWASPKNLDEVVEPLSTYTDPLNNTIKIQEDEIIRLLKENAELKRNMKAKALNDFNDIVSESARAEGQQEAWELALKLRYMDYEDKVECFGLGHDGKEKWIEVMENYTYAEAAAKVAEWKKAKEEICVGDVVMLYEKLGLVTFVGKHVTVITEKGTTFVAPKGDCTKTGRHIDIASMLEQIGGESDA